jgi:antitoxin (DNA-binding transcriptional repressor) of toxin-antitoxin stability system
MKTASVREIRLSFPTVLKAVRDGEKVGITYRGKLVAEIGPPPSAPAKRRPWQDLDQWLAAQPKISVDLGAIVSADRDDLR